MYVCIKPVVLRGPVDQHLRRRGRESARDPDSEGGRVAVTCTQHGHLTEREGEWQRRTQH
jgi:hypothetical protein